jgi:protein-tyrosine phosphatase
MTQLPQAPPAGRDPVTLRMSEVPARGFTAPDVPFMSEIIPGLWQGGCADGLVLPEFIAHVVSLSRRRSYLIGHETASTLAFKMTDSEGQEMGMVDAVAGWVNQCRASGPVLVHCWAGLNRSGLVTARALMLGGMTADEAIGLVRERRSPACLSNTAFEAWLRSLPCPGRLVPDGEGTDRCPG